MATQLSRRRFVQGSAAAGGGLAFAGPLSALMARSAQAAPRRARAVGYGPLQPTPEVDSGIVYLELPAGFSYRLISRQGVPMSDGHPTPGIFDGMAAYTGRGGQTILIRNHENRSRANEITVAVPAGDRYDPDQNVRGGNTKLVVDRNRRLVEDFGVLGGAVGQLDHLRGDLQLRLGREQHGPGHRRPARLLLRGPGRRRRPGERGPDRRRRTVRARGGRGLGDYLYETEDRGDAAFYRFLPNRRPRANGDLATYGGTLQALVVRGLPNFDANAANPGESYPVEWVTIPEPNPPVETGGQSTRAQAQARGAAIFSRTEGIWSAENRLYFDCTDGGEANLGQVWEYTPRGRDGGDLKLIYESTNPADLEAPDNLVVVPATGDVFLQEDGGGDQYVRGVTGSGLIYDFARTVLNSTEFCGGCFSRDGRTFFVNQQGDRPANPTNPPANLSAYTYAIWGPFRGADGRDLQAGGGDDDQRRNQAVGRGSQRGANPD